MKRTPHIGLWFTGSDGDGITGLAVVCGFIHDNRGYTLIRDPRSQLSRELLSNDPRMEFNFQDGETLGGYMLVFRERFSDYKKVYTISQRGREMPIRTWYKDGSFHPEKKDRIRFLELYKPCNWGKFPHPSKLEM